jgi:hypothetical protein
MKLSQKSILLFLLVIWAKSTIGLTPQRKTNSRVNRGLQAVFTPSMDPDNNSVSKKVKKGSITGMDQSIVKKSAATKSLREADSHKKWGVDNEYQCEYWSDTRIHTLGNVGFMGALHAAMAPISTKMIDILAYDGIDIRQKVSQEIKKPSLK